MKICYCHSCDCLFPETDMTIPGYCPICGAHSMMEVIHNKERAMRLSDSMIEELWLMFGDCSFDPVEEVILEDFLDFPVGTDKEEIWHWFDKAYTKGLHDLMYP